MVEFFHKARRRNTANAVIVFEPVTVRAGVVWKAMRLAKAALLAWGGISLAGAAAAAVVYGQGGFDPYLRSAMATPIAQPAKSQDADIVQKRTEPAAGESQAPSARTAVVAAPQPSAAVATPPLSLRDRLLSAPAVAASPPASSTNWLSPAETSELTTPTQPAPLATARLPRARPDEPIITGSIDRRYETRPFRQFRRLHGLPQRYRYRDPYAALPPFRDWRRQHPFFYRR